MEHYSAHHPETVEELLDWPADRFAAFHEAFQKRLALENLEQRKNAIIGGLYGNGNISGDDLNKSIRQLEESFEEARKQIFGTRDTAVVESGGDDLEGNPFFAAMNVPGDDD